jgi:hypothetical protein
MYILIGNKKMENKIKVTVTDETMTDTCTAIDIVQELLESGIVDDSVRHGELGVNPLVMTFTANPKYESLGNVRDAIEDTIAHGKRDLASIHVAVVEDTTD